MGSTLLGWVPALFRAIWPVQYAGEDINHFRWRQVIVAWFVVLSLADSIHVAAACGWLRPFYEGFAQATTVDQINGTVISLLDDSIRSTVTKNKTLECQAEKDRNTVILSYALREKQDAEGLWYRVHGNVFPYEPDCKELIN